MKFQPGESGNPAGRPPDVAKQELREMCRGHVPRSFEIITQIMERYDEKDYTKSAVAAIKLLWEYGFGKPVQGIAFENGPTHGIAFMSSSAIEAQLQALNEKEGSKSTKGKK